MGANPYRRLTGRSDLSYLASQFYRDGYLSASILTAVFFHCLYIVDFFLNEAWYGTTASTSGPVPNIEYRYLTTMEMNHDVSA